MNRQKSSLRAKIEYQRKKLDRRTEEVEDLTMLLTESREMDRLIEAYEDASITS
jgi:hypothetical protein